MIPDLREELASAKLGDTRRTARLISIVGALQEEPGRAFPKAMRDEAALEAFYRFTNSDAFDAHDILAPHAGQTWKRCLASETATLVLHDTSFCSFPGEVTRRGLPRDGKKQGFFLHAALAVAEGNAPRIHGLVGMDVYTCWKDGWLRETGEQREVLLCGSERWSDLVRDVRNAAPAGHSLIHVMDREADDYALWSAIAKTGDHFVIRAQHDRKVTGEAGRLSEAVQLADEKGERNVPLRARTAGARPPKSRRTHPERNTRIARLRMQATCLEFVRPRKVAPLGTPTMKLWVVEVTEIDPPEGEPPVHWRLVTSLPADTPEAAWRVVDIYRKRWLVEEYFKALKTGCALEKRQAESLDSLLLVLALLLPVAWRLLILRTIERDTPDAPAEAVLPELELTVLRQHAPKRLLPREATARDVMLAIAALGGHQRSNGAPGWLILGRGLEHLLRLTEGWRAALAWASQDTPLMTAASGETKL